MNKQYFLSNVISVTGSIAALVGIPSIVNAQTYANPQLILNAQPAKDASSDILLYMVLAGCILSIIILFSAIMKKMKYFQKKDAFQLGWRYTQDNLIIFIPLVLVLGIVQYIPEIATYVLTDVLNFKGLVSTIDLANLQSATFYGAVMSTLKLCLVSLTSITFISVVIDVLDGKKPITQDLFKNVRLIPLYIVANFLFSVFLGIGLIALVIPGIIVGTMLSLWPYFMVDRGYGPIKSLRSSIKATAGARIDLFLFLFLLITINILGGFFFLIGLLVTIPLTTIAMAYIYRTLASRFDSSIPSPVFTSDSATPTPKKSAPLKSLK